MLNIPKPFIIAFCVLVLVDLLIRAFSIKRKQSNDEVFIVKNIFGQARMIKHRSFITAVWPFRNARLISLKTATSERRSTNITIRHHTVMLVWEMTYSVDVSSSQSINRVAKFHFSFTDEEAVSRHIMFLADDILTGVIVSRCRNNESLNDFEAIEEQANKELKKELGKYGYTGVYFLLDGCYYIDQVLPEQEIEDIITSRDS